MKRLDFMGQWKKRYCSVSKDFCFKTDMRVLRKCDITQYADGRVHISAVSRDCAQHYRDFQVETLVKSAVKNLKGTISLPMPYEKYKLPKTAIIEACSNFGLIIDHTLGRVYQLSACGIDYPRESNLPVGFIPWEIHAADKDYKEQMRAYIHKLIQLYNVVAQIEDAPLPEVYQFGSVLATSEYMSVRRILDKFDEGKTAEQTWTDHPELRPSIVWLKANIPKGEYRQSVLHEYVRKRLLPYRLKRPLTIDYLRYRS